MIEPWNEATYRKETRFSYLQLSNILIQHVQPITNPPRLDDAQAQLEFQSKGLLCYWQPYFHPCNEAILLEDSVQSHSVSEYSSLERG